MRRRARADKPPVVSTIEIDDTRRGKLLELAARRGEKGFSHIIAEAIESCLKTVKKSEAIRRDAFKLRGTLSATEADRLSAATRKIRESWR